MYDIDKIIKYAEAHEGLLAADDRQEWVKLCWCLKVLGYDVSSFVAISWASAAECKKVWKAEKAPGRYIKDKDQAAAAIVGMAKAAGVSLEDFRASEGQEWRQQRPTAQEDFASIPTQAEAAGPIEYVDTATLAPMEKAADASNLFKYLCGLFPRAEVVKVFQRYRVGALKTDNGFAGSSTTFPLINAQGQIVDLRIIPYKADGHRAKGNNIIFPVGSWMAMQHKKDLRGELCPFGEHLAAAATIVGLVESEKTAMMAALALPGSTWLATTSLNNLNPRRLQAIKGHELKVFPDIDGIVKWRGKVEELRAEGFNISFCSGFITRHAQGPKEDLGDIIERWRREGNNE